jgi:hypothetical protein
VKTPPAKNDTAANKQPPKKTNVEQPAKPKPDTKPQANNIVQQKGFNATKSLAKSSKEIFNERTKIQEAKPKDIYSHKDKYNNLYN